MRERANGSVREEREREKKERKRDARVNYRKNNERERLGKEGEFKRRRSRRRRDCWERSGDNEITHYDPERSHERRSRLVIVIAVTHCYRTISPVALFTMKRKKRMKKHCNLYKHARINRYYTHPRNHFFPHS